MNAVDLGRWAVRAEQAFWRARRAASVERIVSWLCGRPAGLIPFDPVARRLGLLNCRDRGLKEVPLDRIVGSTGKAEQFTRSFRPRSNRLRERWKQIYALVQGSTGAPPVELYQVGECYFVKDGHHRVSVARELGATVIEAYVTEYLCPDRMTLAKLDRVAAGAPADTTFDRQCGQLTVCPLLVVMMVILHGVKTAQNKAWIPNSLAF